MQKKKTLLSACIALALSGQGWSAEVTDVEVNNGDRKNAHITCSSKVEKRNPQDINNQSSECDVETDKKISPWIAVGTTLLTTLAAIELLDSDNHHAHSAQPTPTPPNGNGDEPAGGGDEPAGGGDEPAGGGDEPAGGGDEPAGGGDEPAGGGDEPAGGGDDPAGGGDEPAGGGDDPAGGGDDPAGGGDEPAGGDTPKNDPVKYDNDVIWDKDAKTIQLRDAVFTYTQNEDGSYTLTGKNGKTTVVKHWEVHNETNTVAFEGVNSAGGVSWSYDDNGTIHIIKETGLIADGTTGYSYYVNDAVITDQGGNTALNGGIVMEITGNNITLNNDGKTKVLGENSVVAILTGDDITINNNGNIEVDAGTAAIINGDRVTLNTAGDAEITNGGTGSLIEGNDAQVDNKGKMTVDGKNSTGSKIIGDNATVKQEGDLYVSSGAHGIEIVGKEMIVSNKGNITVVDENSIGAKLDGNNTTFINMGDISVSNGSGAENAVGVQLTGDNATFMNVGDISVANAGAAVRIKGDSGDISLAGGMYIGDFSTGLDVSGNNNTMTLATYELNVTGQDATGVNISGNGNAINIAGNILVDKDQSAQNAEDYFYIPSTGISVNGDSNKVTLDGQLTMVADSELANRRYVEFDGSQENIHGLVVEGDNNIIELNGGIRFIGEQNALNDGETIAAGRSGQGDTPVISISGESSVYLNGDSVIAGAFPVGYANIIQVSDKALLEIGRDASFTMQDIDVYNHYFMESTAIIKAETGAQIINNGDVNIQNVTFIELEGKGSSAINNGNIELQQYDYSSTANPSAEAGGAALQSIAGASVTNNAVIMGKVMEQHSIFNTKDSMLVTYYTNPNNKVVSLIGMEAIDNSFAFNAENGLIDMYGRGTVGMAVMENSTAQNAGDIIVDTLWLDENDTTTLRDDIPGGTARNYGAGMSVGTDDFGTPGSNATAINKREGTITIYNAGAGMVAYGKNNTVINQGTINLKKNDNYDNSLGNNILVGMAAYNYGSAINDTTGVINIDAEIGRAFYNDGTGVIVNYGTICTFGICKGSGEYNSTDSAVAALFNDGDILSTPDQTVTLNTGAAINGTVTNAGKVRNGTIQLFDGATLVNESTGTINSDITVTSGSVLVNEGVLNSVDLAGGTFNNNGTLNSTVKIEKGSDAVINNTGSLSTLQLNDGTVNNSGIATARVNAQGNAVFNNLAGGEARKGAILYNSAVVNNAGTWKLGYQNEGNNTGTLDIDDQSMFNNSGKLILDNSKNAIRFQGNNANATLYNTGEMTLDAALGAGAIHYDNGASQFINNGMVDAKVTVAVSITGATSGDGFLWNQNGGVINFDKDNASAIKFTHNNYVALNDGEMNISGSNAVAMEGDKNAQLVNNGTINLGTEGTTDTGMIGMQLDANATADAVIENNGTINIFANDSFAFSVLGTEGHVVNNGTVVIADGVTGSGLIMQGDSVNVEGVNGNNGNNTKVHYGDYTLPDVPNTNTVSVTPGSDATDGGMNNLNGYVVGTSADGSAGKLKVNNASMNGVGINTGFTSGTADTTVSFDNVVEGSNLTDADAITSTSVVWTAKGSTDANGNVDVTMSKNAYTDVATDASVNDIAKALDAGYTNNELFTSLNVGTTAELNSALKQVSGSQATTVFREARVLSNRFSMLADAAPKVGNGLAFNVVAKGDPRAELGNNTEYDMLALRKTVDLSESQTMILEYGIARLDGDGAQKAGDNGVTGGYSQFFGLKHQMSFDNGMNWNNALRYDVHNLDSSRSIAFSNTNKTADTDVKQQYLEFRSEGAKTFEPSEGLKVTPYAGVKLRHTLEGGYQERNAGDFNLSMNSGSETAVDSIVGLKLDYAGKDGWSANATLEGGPNLSYSKSQRTASLAGAGSQHFNVDDGQKGGGINSLASVGVKYSSKESSLNLDAYHWKEDGISDKGVMLNFKKTF